MARTPRLGIGARAAAARWSSATPGGPHLGVGELGAKLATEDETGGPPSSGQKLKRYCEGASPVEGSRLAGTLTRIVAPWMRTELPGRFVVAPLARSMTCAVGVSDELSWTTITASNVTLGRLANGPGGRLPLRSTPQT